MIDNQELAVKIAARYEAVALETGLTENLGATFAGRPLVFMMPTLCAVSRDSGGGT